ncbi:hypothetical protein GBAR_LOCUS24654 [Geodia barretti]|uniref:Uncharacterized protein n=1 Tax=Geodia barretti TaxID=519541 RepID=A0AA35TAY6_GEOBA|nr:hypothetical protein GBAR_LOCUS24654 [Geodia barretti]
MVVKESSRVVTFVWLVMTCSSRVDLEVVHAHFCIFRFSTVPHSSPLPTPSSLFPNIPPSEVSWFHVL